MRERNASKPNWARLAGGARIAIPAVAAILVLTGWMIEGTPQALGQETTAEILGTVTDVSGAAIPGAEVTATNEATGRSYTTTSSAEGNYEFPLLPITGSYRINVAVKGFEKFQQVGIVLRVLDRVRVDPKLQVGATTQTVEVTARPAQVNTTTTSLGDVIENRAVQELPLNGRNPLQLAELVAGVTQISAPAVFAWRGGGYLSVNGTRSDENDVLIDGAHYEGSYFNNAYNLPSPDALEEFKLITNTYPAEFGRNAGSVLNSVIKSGTNQIHGSAFEFLRNTDLNARNFFLNSPGAKTAELVQNQYGGTAGGPIIKDKFFVFGSYQGLRIAQQTIATALPPTTQERDGFFTMPAGQPLMNPATGTPFPQTSPNVYYINPSTFNPVATAMTSRYLTSYNGESLLPAANGVLTTIAPNPTDVQQIIVKGDTNIKSTNLLNVTYMQDHTQRFDPIFGASVPGYAVYSPTNKVTLLSLNDTHSFSPTRLNEIRISYMHALDLLGGCAPVPPPSAFGIQGFNVDPNIGPKLPAFSVSGRFNLADQSLCNIQEATLTRQLADNFTWIRGKHTIKFGGELMKNMDYSWFANAENPNFTVSGAVTGNAMADFFLGLPSQYTRANSAYDYMVSWEGAGFFQDDWKVNRRLTLNLGLRYFLQQPWYCPDGRCGPSYGIPGPSFFATFIPGTHTQRFTDAPLGELYVGDPGVPKGIYYQDRNDWEPRVGIALDPTGSGKTAVRLSYGVFHDIVTAHPLSVANNEQPYLFREIFNFPVGGFSNPYEDEPNPWPYRAFLSSNPPFYPNQSLTGLSQGIRNPFIQGVTVDVQRQVTESFMADLAYTGKWTTQLEDNSVVNPPTFIPGTDPTTGQPYSTGANENSRRDYYNLGYGQIQMVNSGARAWFNSLQFTTRYRLRHGLSFQTAYTWSQSLDIASAYTAAGSPDPQDPNCYIHCEKGLSSFDLTHVLRTMVVYNAPSPFKSVQGFTGKVVRNVADGWEISEITSLTSGFPFSCNTGVNNLLNALSADRCDTVGNWKLPGGRSHGQEVAEWFNTAAFIPNGIGQDGTSQRDFLRGPHQFDTDFALFKNFKIGERYGNLQFRSEFFNVFNEVQFNNPVNTLSSGAHFGQITSANNPRLIQLALKYVF